LTLRRGVRTLERRRVVCALIMRAAASGADANPHGNRVHRWQRDVRGRRQGTESFD